MDLNLIRKQTLKTASRLGYSVNDALPLLDEVHNTRTADEAVKRLLCLHATAACAYGFDHSKARAWLERENALGDLTASELHFIEGGEGDPNQFKIQVEGMWALAWALGIVPHLDFSKGCDSKFVMMLPNLKIGEKSDTLRSKIKTRAADEIIEACDLAYCLHGAARQAKLTGGKMPGKVQPYVIEERRRALEWLLSNDRWDEVSLDT
jgi:hypothetical protein